MAANSSRAFSQSRRDGAVGDAQDGGDFLLGHAGEIAHLDHLHQARVLDLQGLDGVVDLDDFVLPGAQVFGELCIERHVHGVAAAALRLALSREVDDDRAHDARRVGEEVAALGAGELAGALEAQKALVQQHGGVQQRVAAAIAQLPARLAAQVFICHREQPLARGFVAGVRALDQMRQLVHERGLSLSQRRERASSMQKTDCPL